MNSPLLALCVLISVNAFCQTKTDTAFVLLEAVAQSKLNISKFKDRSGTPNSVYFIKNQVIEPDSMKRSFSSNMEVAGHHLFFFLRKDLAGFHINYWIQVDKLALYKDSATVSFQTISSADNWFPEFDRPLESFHVELEKIASSWVVKSGRRERKKAN